MNSSLGQCILVVQNTITARELVSVLEQLPPNTRISPWSYRTFQDKEGYKALIDVKCLLLESHSFKELREGEFPPQLRYELGWERLTGKPNSKLHLGEVLKPGEL